MDHVLDLATIVLTGYEEKKHDLPYLKMAIEVSSGMTSFSAGFPMDRNLRGPCQIILNRKRLLLPTSQAMEQAADPWLADFSETCWE
jgi:hypothetical protein